MFHWSYVLTISIIIVLIGITVVLVVKSKKKSATNNTSVGVGVELGSTSVNSGSVGGSLHPLATPKPAYPKLKKIDCQNITSFRANEKGGVLLCPYEALSAPEQFINHIDYVAGSCGTDDLPCTKCYFSPPMVARLGGPKKIESKMAEFNQQLRKLGYISRNDKDIPMFDNRENSRTPYVGKVSHGLVVRDTVCYPDYSILKEKPT